MMKNRYLLLLAIIFTALDVSAKQVSCNKLAVAGGLKRTLTFSTQPTVLNVKIVKEDGSILADTSLLTEGTEKALVSEFSKNCSASITEPVVNRETYVNWTFMCRNGVTGNFVMTLPSNILGALTVRSPDGTPIVYYFGSADCSYQ